MEETKDTRSRAQRWADVVTEFSGSWTFIFWFTGICIVWVLVNLSHAAFDPYPFLFLNWILTVVSTFQNPVILLSQNRQNEVDRVHVQTIISKLDTLLERIPLADRDALQEELRPRGETGESRSA